MLELRRLVKVNSGDYTGHSKGGGRTVGIVNRWRSLFLRISRVPTAWGLRGVYLSIGIVVQTFFPKIPLHSSLLLLKRRAEKFSVFYDK